MVNEDAIEYFNTHAYELSERYATIDRAMVHADLLRHLPDNRLLEILDIGAGSGDDAQFFAGMGHFVTAVEPAEEMRNIGKKSFKNKNINWKSDLLPDLRLVTRLNKRFDVVYTIGALQYLDKNDRTAALQKMANLVLDGGLIEIQYPISPSREYQFAIHSNEILDFIKVFNQKAQGRCRLEILEQKTVKELTGRKALNGSELFFSVNILKLMVKRT